MSTSFQIDGKQWTRLSYIQKELNDVIRYQLRSDQKFNILVFSSGVWPWAPGLQPVNQSNIDLAVRFVSGLTANGGTNAFSALATAFQDPLVAGIYFLSDGEPDSGQTPKILQYIKNVWEVGKNRAIPVHTTALAATPEAQIFMKQVSQLTGGIYRSIQSS